MTWPASIPPLWIAALAVSLALAVINWRSMTSGQRIETPDGLGGRRIYSRFQLAAIPPLMIGAAGFAFFVMAGNGSAGDMRVFVSLWIVAVLIAQCGMIGMALKVRRDRRQRRVELFGE